MIKSLLLLTALVFCLSSSAAQLQGPFEHMIVFGDSLSDIGNNTWVAAEGGIKGAPIVNVDQATHKKQIWVQDLNATLFPNQKIYTLAEAQKLRLNPNQANIDYAFASAETGMDYLNDLTPDSAYPLYDTNQCTKPGRVSSLQSCVPGVDRQVALYLQAVNQQVNPHTLFIIWAGGNDMFNNVSKLLLLYHMSGSNWVLFKGLVALLAGRPFEADGIVFSNPVHNLATARDMLLAAGASPKQILFINLPNIAIVPAAVSMAGGHNAFLHLFTAVSLNFNGRLRIATWDTPMFSIYGLLNTLVKHPADYGLTEVKRSCVMDQKLPYCQGYLFFNDKHPTAIVGQILTNKLLQQENL